MVSQSLQQTEVMSLFEYHEQNIVSLSAPIGMGNNAKFTRCLSFEKSAKALRGCFNSLWAVISCLQTEAIERTTAGRATLPGLLKQIASCKFIATTVHTLFGRLHWYNWFTIKVFIVMLKQK